VPKSVLTRKRSLIARFAVLVMVFSLMAVALPASAHSVALDSTGPCPVATPSAGFTDIGGFDATTQTAINCLFAFGITTGTSATTYSPDGVVPRWQMALFLVRQAADHGLTIPAAVSQGYTDIGAFDTATQNAINQITQMGISKGTSTTTFSPDLGVSRWQMALFIHRTGVAAGVTFNDTVGHNDFTDIGGQLAEAQTSINALADTRADPEGHIALGTGGSLFSPELPVLRWQMALFLTRLLAADNVSAVAGVRVTVTPTAAATQSGLTARAYEATFKNADGTNYTGAVGVTLRQVVSGVIEYDNVPPSTAVFETPSDGLAGAGTTTIEGFPGTNGVITFVVRHVGATQTVVPIAWEDLDNDNLPEISGNTAPTEPYGLGGFTTFSSPATEAAAGAHVVDVVSTSLGSDSFVGNYVAALGDCGNGADADCTFNYDANDLFLVSGVPVADLAAFEAELNAGDVVTTSPYDPDTADQSTFNISTNNDPVVTITDPAAGGVTVDAATYTITGTGVVGYTVAIYTDADNGTTINGTDAKVGEGVVDGAGTWSIVVPLSQNTTNNFTANQRALPADANGTLVDVPTITEGANTAALIASTTSVNGGVATVLDTGDTITINFSENVTAPTAGDVVAISETGAGGSAVSLTCGTNATCSADDADTISLLVTAPPTITNVGDNGQVNTTGIITGLTGFVGTDGQNVNVAGSAAATRTFTPF
jgi:hypothetical protein